MNGWVGGSRPRPSAGSALGLLLLASALSASQAISIGTSGPAGIASAPPPAPSHDRSIGAAVTGGSIGPSGGRTSAISPAGAVSGPPIGWFPIGSGRGPSARELAALAYDPLDGYTVLFGGGLHAAGVSYGDTWTYSNGTWTELRPNPAPPGRIGAGFVYDARDHDLVLFGGFNESTQTFLNDTWTFASGHWTQVLPTTAPSPRWLFGMAYDPVAQEVVLFGGGDFSSLGETWVFSAGSWSEVATPVSPPYRSDTGMVYDPLDGGVLLFGGSGNGSGLSDSWIFASGRWTLEHPAVAPPGSFDFGIGYDPRLPGVVVASGGVESSNSAVISWVFGHGVWTNLTPRLISNYGLRGHQTIAWDGQDDYLLQFGGVGSSGYLAQAWALDVLNATGAPLNLSGEAPCRINVSASASYGVPPISFAWNLSNGADLAQANGSLAVPTAGGFTLDLTVHDSLGVTVSLGPFEIAVVPAVALTATALPTHGTAPLNVSVSASASEGVPPYGFTWAFGDGPNESGANLSHTYRAAGRFSLVATVEDANGHVATRTFSVTVTAAPSNGNSSGPTGSTSNGALTDWVIVGLVASAVVVIGGIALLVRRRRT